MPFADLVSGRSQVMCSGSHPCDPRQVRPTPASRRTPVCLGPFLYLDELIRHQPVGFAMDCNGGFLIGCLDQTERPTRT